MDFIKNAKSLKDIQLFLEKFYPSIEAKDESFIQIITDDWDCRILSKKLIDLKENDLAERIDKINPDQEPYAICQQIYKIICNAKEVSCDGSHESFHYDIGENATSDIEWGVFL